MQGLHERYACSGHNIRALHLPGSFRGLWKPQFDDEGLDTLLNPLLVVEVLSRTTSNYDRGAKFSMYRRLDSLKECLFVEQDVVRVEQYVRQPGGKWLLTEAAGLKDSLKLASVPVILKLRSVYRQVELPVQ